MSTRTSIALMLAFVGVAMGCAAPSNDAGLSPTGGWREGIVFALQDGPAEPNRWAKDCRQDSFDATRRDHHVEVEFRLAARRTRISVPVRPDANWRIGERILVNVLDCEPRLRRTNPAVPARS